MRLQRVARADKPPQPVQPETLQRDLADLDMPFMRRIERSPQKAHHLPRSHEWRLGQGTAHMSQIPSPLLPDARPAATRQTPRFTQTA